MKQRKVTSLKSTVVIALLIAIAFLNIYPVSAPTGDGFNVTWTLSNNGLTQKEYIVEVQNLNSTSNKDFNLSAIISETNYDASISEIKLYEWKSLLTELPVFEITAENYTVFNNSYDNSTGNWTNTSVNSSHNVTVQNGTVNKNVSQWKDATGKVVNKNLSENKENYDVINIPKYGSRGKPDDFGVNETENGTKKFKVVFTTPIVQTGIGWGSSGKIAIIDEVTGIEYHPYWNDSYYKTPLLINNTGNASVLTDFQVLVNITYNSTYMDANLTSLHLVNETSGAELVGRFWIDRNNSLNGSYFNIVMNLSSIPASAWDNTTYALYHRNVTEVDASNGTNTFVFFDDFSGDLSKWNLTQSSAGNVQIVDGEARITGNGDWNTNGMASILTFERPIVIEWLSRASTLSMYTDEGYSNGLNNTNGVAFTRNLGGSLLERRKDGIYLNIGAWTIAQAKHKIILKSAAGYTIFLNDVQKEDDTAWTTNNLKLVFQTYTSEAYSYIDNIYVRKSASPEPTAQLGVTESSAFIPPIPVIGTVTTGNFWKNITWSAGSGNVITNSYNVSRNGTWTNGTTTLFKNSTTTAHGWINDTIYAYNSSGTGTLNTSALTNNTQIPDNSPVISGSGSISSSSFTTAETATISVTNITDADDDITTVTVQAGVTLLGGNEVNYTMATTDNVMWTYIYSTLTSGTYTITNYYASNSYGSTKKPVAIQFTVTSSSSGGGGGGGGGGGTTIIIKETDNATAATPLLRLKNITEGATEPQLQEIADCFTEGLFMENKCSGFSYGVVVETMNWWVFFGTFAGAGIVVVGRGIKQDRPREWFTEPLLYGTTTTLIIVILVAVGFNMYFLNYLTGSPKYAWTFGSLLVWGGIVALVWDEYYYGKKTYKIRSET